MAIANYGQDSPGGVHDDLAIGKSGPGPADFPAGGVAVAAGRLHVLYGTAGGLTTGHVQVWDAGKVDGRVAQNANFG
jgi:hypothetical protein